MNNKFLISIVAVLAIAIGIISWGTTNTHQNLSEAAHTPFVSQVQSNYTETSSSASDFIQNKPSLFSGSFASLSSIPTTLAGYGITNAYPLTGNPSLFLTSITSGEVITALGYTPTPTLYSTYQASVTQAGTSAPTAVQLANSFSGGVTFTWARTGTGTYTITASSAVFTANKTKVYFGQLNSALGYITATITSTTVITINTQVTSILSLVLTTGSVDAMMTATPVDIQVYP